MFGLKFIRIVYDKASGEPNVVLNWQAVGQGDDRITCRKWRGVRSRRRISAFRLFLSGMPRNRLRAQEHDFIDARHRDVRVIDQLQIQDGSWSAPCFDRTGSIADKA